MKPFVVLSSVLAASQAAVIPALAPAPIPATTLVRAPAHDSATIESHRLGGNFAYSTAEAHAFAEVSPQLATRKVAVAETTNVHTPAAIKTVQPAPIVSTHHVAQPVLAQQNVYRNEPVIGPVAAHTTYKRPIYKTRTYTQTAVATQPIVKTAVQAVAAPVTTIAAAAAPAPVLAAGTYAAAAPLPATAYAAAAPLPATAYAAAAPLPAATYATGFPAAIAPAGISTAAIAPAAAIKLH